MFSKLIPGFLVLALVSACARYEPDRDLDTLNARLEGRGLPPLARQTIVPEGLEPMMGPVTMDKAVTAALRYNASLQTGIETLNLADARRIQAGLLINPNLTGEFLIEEGGAPLELTFGLGIDLSRLLTRSWRVRTAEAEQQAVRAEVTSLVVGTVMTARLAVFDLWAADRRQEIARQITAARTSAVDVAEELSRVGNLERGRLARARALLARAELERAMADLAVLDAKRALSDVTGLPLGLDVSADLGTFPTMPPDKGAFVRSALDSSFVLEAERARLAALGARSGLAGFEVWLSQIEAGVIAEREEDEWGEGFEISLPVPVFDLGRTRRGAAVAALHAAQNRYKALYVNVGNYAAALFEALKRLKHLDDDSAARLLTAAEADFDFENRRFNAMQVGPLLLIEARVNQLLAEQAVLEVRRQRLATHMEMLALSAGVMMPQDRSVGLMAGPGAVPEGDH